MPQTPEELTKEWLNNKLQAGSFWFVETEDSNPEPMVVDMEGDLNDYEGNYYRPCFSKGKLKVLAPIPTYNEYKAMQAELAEHRRYCCCSENEVMQLKLAKMEEKNKIWDELAENLLYLEEGNWENLVKNGTKEHRLDFLKRKEKYSLLAILDKYEKLKKELESARWYQTAQNEDIGKLRGLLKECLPIVSAEIMTWQIRGGEESHKRGQDLLTRINAALGESEER